MKILWHKHSLMISSSVGSAQYSWGISYEYLTGWGNLSRKIISIKRNHYSNLVFFFFQVAISLLARVATYQENFIFGEATSSHFFRVTTSTEQLYFRSSYFFRAAAFFSFFRTATFSKQVVLHRINFFRKATFWKKLMFQKSNITH